MRTTRPPSQIDYVLDGNGQPADYAKGDPLANLDLIRVIFFSVPGQSLGGRKKHVLIAGAAFDPALPDGRGVRRERDVGAVEHRCS